MRIALLSSVTLILLCITSASGAAPEDDAIAQYRAYVAAIRAGNSEAALKLVEPVPKSSEPLLTARIAMLIALEDLKAEMIAQMGPAKTGDDAWAIGGLPYDDVLGNLKGVASGEDAVGIFAKEPEGMLCAWMIRQDGKWIVPAGLVMDLEPAPQFVEPGWEEREASREYANKIAKAVRAVLSRLKKKEFKTPAEVVAAFGNELSR
jgi:hypothetical protein